MLWLLFGCGVRLVDCVTFSTRDPWRGRSFLGRAGLRVVCLFVFGVVVGWKGLCIVSDIVNDIVGDKDG